MSEQTIPGFVYAADLIKQAQATEHWLKAETKRSRRSRNGWRAYSLVVTGLLGISISALNYAIPSIRLLPILLWTSPDGVTGAAVTTDSLPADLSDASIKAWLWQYVMHRESYSWVEADYNHYVVEAMSDVPVREAYDRWINAKNRDSYLNKFGRRCVVRVAPREVTEFRRASSTVPGRFTLHFDRLVSCEDERKTSPDTWTVTLEYLAGYGSGLNIRDILAFNPSRIVVTSYPGALPLPAEPNAQQ
jgi:type IV secretory pathway component VirB8